MKQLFLLATTLLFSVCTVAATPPDTSAKRNAAKKVEVYYFHFTHRCPTCRAVEAESKKALETFYGTQIANKQISFVSINLDEKGSKMTADKCKAEGQSLLLLSGGKRIDLTDKAFLYARSNPARLKVILKTEVDKLLK